MSSVNEILTRLNLSRRDLSNVSLSQLETVFKNLTVKEISTLCAVNRRFNTLCKNESFWKRKVSDDYGIKKKYGDTWRKTAITMDKVDMINLSAKLIDGITYMEILNDTVQNGAITVLDLQFLHLIPYLIHDAADLQFDVHDEKSMQDLADEVLSRDYVNDDVTDLQVGMHDENTIQDFANANLDKPYTSDELNAIFLIKSRAIDVIYATVVIYKGGGIYLPGDTLDDSITAGITTGMDLQPYQFLRDMIDPIIYVMQFSTFSHDRLRLIR